MGKIRVSVRGTLYAINRKHTHLIERNTECHTFWFDQIFDKVEYNTLTCYSYTFVRSLGPTLMKLAKVYTYEGRSISPWHRSCTKCNTVSIKYQLLIDSIPSISMVKNDLLTFVIKVSTSQLAGFIDPLSYLGHLYGD